MSHSKVSQLDACFAVLLDNVTANIRLALLALDYDSIMTATSDHVLPNLGCAELGPLCACDFDAVLVASLNLIFDQNGWIVVDFNADLVQIELVTSYLFINREAS